MTANDRSHADRGHDQPITEQATPHTEPAGVAAVRRAIALGSPPVATIASIIAAAPADRDAILILLHQTLGSSYVQRVVAASTGLAGVATDLAKATRQALPALGGEPDPDALAQLAAALHAMSAQLLAKARSPSPTRIAPLLDKIANAVATPPRGTPDEVRVALADAIVDPALEAYDIAGSLGVEADALRDGDLRATIVPLGQPLNDLRNFAAQNASPRFATDLRGLRTAARALFDVGQRASDAEMKMPSATAMYDAFDGMYRALAQAAPEVPAAAKLADALHPIEAAFAQNRKPNQYATAALALVQPFIDQLATLTHRGPWNASAWIPEIAVPLTRGLGWIEAKGTVAAHETRASAKLYAERTDPAEDPRQTEQLAERHATGAGPVPDAKPPAPAPVPHRPLSTVAKEFKAASLAAFNAMQDGSDPEAVPALLPLLHELSADLLINPRTPSPPRIAPLLDKIAAALARPFTGTPDEIRAQEADAIADPTYEAYDISNGLVWEGQTLPDAELAAAGGPINEGLNYLRNFAMFHAPPRFDTDVRKLQAVAKKFFDLAHRASDAMTQMPAATEQFTVFEALYEALAQAEPEIPAAHALFLALQPLEAALASRRKPNTYATACQAPLEAFLTGLDAVVNRGPWGTNRWFPMISQPLREGIGWLIAKGTTAAGETPMGAYEYQRSADPPEDPAATAALAERHDEILHPRASP